ncbi:hypothetical protein LTR65_003889 [Meristemomyces frigidus]
MPGADLQGRILCAHCQRHANSACKGCLLVLYCGAGCQKTHWSTHKQDCKSPLIKKDWKPQWDLADREPAFVDGSGTSMHAFGGKKFFWGNVPAVDVLRIADNEGEEYDSDIRLLFAASGDPRNVIKTLESIPKAYGRSIHAHVNDRDLDIVARNAIILLLMLTVQDKNEAAECMIHIWYSARIRQSDIDLLRSVRGLIDAVCKKIAGKAPGTVLGKKWTFANASLRLVLTKEQWSSLLGYFDVPVGLSLERAQRIRTEVTLADSRVDYRERRMIGQVPAHRVCGNRFREDGILLPFGHHRHLFIAPNPTFYQTADWPMKDSADPLEGWALDDILQAGAGPATNDVYGKLFYYLKGLLFSCQRRLSSLNVSFELSNCAAEDLGKQLKADAFARIEASYAENGHATLLTLFMNAVDETVDDSEIAASTSAELTALLEYLPHRGGAPPRSMNDSRMILMNFLRPLVRDVDKYFNRYMELENFRAVEQYLGLRMKDPHTIIDKWPMRLRLQQGQAGAQEEFDLLLSSSHTGNERYVEWKRVD